MSDRTAPPKPGRLDYDGMDDTGTVDDDAEVIRLLADAASRGTGGPATATA